MQRLLFRLLSTLAAATLGVVILWYEQQLLTDRNNLQIHFLKALHHLQTDVSLLQRHILEASMFLYYDNDHITHGHQEIDHHLQTLSALLFDRQNYPKTKHALRRYQKEFALYSDLSQRFLTYNAAIKNSTIYLPTLTLKALQHFNTTPQENAIVQLLSKIDATVSIGKRSLDQSLIQTLQTSIAPLRHYEKRVDHPQKKRLLQAYRRHLAILISTFKPYHTTLQRLLAPAITDETRLIEMIFSKEFTKELSLLQYLSYALFALYLLSIGVVAFLLFLTEREYQLLQKVQAQLKKSLYHDSLTGLGNRQAFWKKERTLTEASLLLINIDRFGHINEIYGTTIGDRLLQWFAKKLQNLCTIPDSHLFRVGGDDFGLLVAHCDTQILLRLTQQIGAYFHTHPFHHKEITIDLSVSIGISREKERLLESADIALKAAKRSRNHYYALYDDTLDNSKQIERNIQAIKRLKKAIAQERIVPYFQPIYDLSTQEIVKYEALARLIEKDRILTPIHFLDAAKQTKMLSRITHIILARTLQVAEQKGGHFSVNLSIDDIENQQTQDHILTLLRRYHHVAPHITFELLETEEISDYDAIMDFIGHIKHFGASIAIDDFGSGYANFEKLLLLNLDILKIDGTLIKRLDRDPNAKIIVKMIVDFAKATHKKTVAEFIHNKAVLQAAQTLGINWGQGFYLSPPLSSDAAFQTPIQRFTDNNVDI